MSRASSFLGVFPSFRLRFAFPGGRGAQPRQWWGDGARPGPCPDPRGAAALLVRRLGANQSVPAELRVAVLVAPERVRVSAWGAMSGDVHRGTRYTRSATPRGPPTQGAMAALAGWQPDGAPNPRERAPGEHSTVRRAQGTARGGPASALPPSSCPASPSGICC